MNDYKDEDISAFAFRVGKQIETIIKNRTVDLVATNSILESKILQWYASNGHNPKFAEFFDIKECRTGLIPPKDENEEKNI